MPEGRPKFGDWLVDQERLSLEQLDEGLRSQTVYGGRLGTNLVEIGYLGLDELALELTRYYELPLAPTPWLESPEKKAIKLVPMALCRRLKILPLHLDRDAVHVAMLDPDDPDQLDFVTAAANRRVVAYVLPEVRLLYWLETHLQIDRHPRFVNLATRIRRTDMKLADAQPSSLGHVVGEEPSAVPQKEPSATSSKEPSAASSEDPQLATSDQAPALLDRWFEDDVLRPELESGEKVEHNESAQPDEEEELLLEELVVEVVAPAPAQPEARASGPLTAARVAELEAQLQGSADRDAIASGILELARAYCEVAVLFVVHGGKVTPLRASGGGVQQRLEGLSVPLGVHSIFSHPAVTGFAFRGSPPEGGIDGRLLEGIDRADVHDLLVQPVRIRDRVVNLLYCDNGSSAFGETSVAALGAVADCASRAYERLILERKRSRSV